MKYKVRVSELRYGEVEVEAASEREAKTKATGMAIDFFDSEITDMTAEKVVQIDPKSVIERLEKWAKGDTCNNCPARDDTVFQAAELLREAYLEEPRTYTVTELCPHCESEVEMIWNADVDGFKAFCPHCGKRLMLCDECLHSGTSNCDYSMNTDSCRHNLPVPDPYCRRLWMRLGVSIPLTRSEMVLVKNGGTKGAETIRTKVSEGAFELDGESYAPAVEGNQKCWAVNDDIDFNFLGGMLL